ncbi:unnamed protein product [Gongylonema pulchrum]|uniref:Uncharacterized protein n=1 Tax=Gongylonema pulchrum TaxID=637853 RepID=A0A183DIA2_9BILA|nr:unnamed protein product [Gongylonema pulchrum]
MFKADAEDTSKSILKWLKLLRVARSGEPWSCLFTRELKRTPGSPVATAAGWLSDDTAHGSVVSSCVAGEPGSLVKAAEGDLSWRID